VQAYWVQAGSMVRTDRFLTG